MKKKQLEIACFNYESALIAEESGAHRIELCENMNLGGTTPNYVLAVRVREKLSIKMHVIIRPRGGDFVYTDEEFVEMKKSFVGRKPNTKYNITPMGKHAFEQHITALEKLIKSQK